MTGFEVICQTASSTYVEFQFFCQMYANEKEWQQEAKRKKVKQEKKAICQSSLVYCKYWVLDRISTELMCDQRNILGLSQKHLLCKIQAGTIYFLCFFLWYGFIK